MGCERALKLVSLADQSKRGAERARREARIFSTLEHPAVVTCHALFELPKEACIGLVLDLVEGRSLAHAAHDPRMTERHRGALIMHVARALEHVHGKGIVHRDVTPSNVLVTDTFWATPDEPGTVKLVDFGIAAPEGNPDKLTAINAFIGTLRYVAPEVLLQGPWATSPDHFTRDVFAFGVLAWELWNGAHPTGLSPGDVSTSYITAYEDALERRRDWPPLGVASPFVAAVRASLEINPARRPQDGAALVVALETGQFTTIEPAPAAGARRLARTETKQPISRPRAPAPPPLEAGFTLPMHPPLVGVAPASSRTANTLLTNVGEAAPRSEGPRRGASGLFTAVAVAATLLLAGAVSYAVATAVMTTRTQEDDPPPPKAASPPPIPALVADKDPPGPVLAPCCSGAGGCKSGRLCRAAPCANEGLPRGWWRVRVTGAALRTVSEIETGPPDAFRHDMARSHPYGRVCLRRVASPGEEVCVPIQVVAKTGEGDRDHRLRVTTADLTSSGVEIRVEDGSGGILANDRIALNQDGITTGVLCHGLKLYVGPRSKALARVLAYLDDD